MTPDRSKDLDRPLAADDLEWAAVLYLLGEADDAETAAFEARLADDQSAREALASATLLVQALAAAAPAAPVVRPVEAPSRRRAFAAAALALTAAAAALLLVLGGPRGPEEVAVRSPVDPARLVVLWSESDPALEPSVAESDEIGQADIDADGPNALLPPDWLIAAVETDLRATDGGTELDLAPELDAVEEN